MDPRQKIISVLGINPWKDLNHELTRLIYRVYGIYTNPHRPFYIPGSRLKEGVDYLECQNYMSRSGMTYDVCYSWRSGRWVIKTGFTPISAKVLEYINEGLWHHATGKTPPKEFRDVDKEWEVVQKVLDAMGYDESAYRYLVIRLACGFTIYVKRLYGIRNVYAIDNYTLQNNLVAYRLYGPDAEPLPIIHELLQFQQISISNHIIKGRMFIVGERYTGSSSRYARHIIDAMIVITDGELWLNHPEHGPAYCRIPPGWYLLLHHSVYTRDGYVE